MTISVTNKQLIMYLDQIQRPFIYEICIPNLISVQNFIQIELPFVTTCEYTLTQEILVTIFYKYFPDNTKPWIVFIGHFQYYTWHHSYLSDHQLLLPQFHGIHHFLVFQQSHANFEQMFVQ